MLRRILAFLIVALIAGAPGFTGIAGVAAENHRREAAPSPSILQSTAPLPP
jgi:hypothetical protein